MFFSQLESLTDSELKQLKLLREFIKDISHACVAFSGGVDSSCITLSVNKKEFRFCREIAVNLKFESKHKV